MLKRVALLYLVISLGIAQLRAQNDALPPQKIQSVDITTIDDDPKATARLLPFRFASEPSVGQRVTVVRLQIVPPDFAPPDQDFQMYNFTIRGIKRHRGGCGTKDAVWWSGIAQLTPTSKRRYFNYLNRVSSSVLVVYPAVAFARPVSTERLQLGLLSQAISISEVIAAVDLDRDGQPDLLVVKNSTSHCTTQCYDYYQKEQGVWVLLSHTPC